MVRAKLTRADGSTLELEGTSEEVAAVLAWERPAQPAQLQPIIVPLPYQPPTLPYQPVWPLSPTVCGTNGATGADVHSITVNGADAPAPS